MLRLSGAAARLHVVHAVVALTEASSGHVVRRVIRRADVESRLQGGRFGHSRLLIVVLAVERMALLILVVVRDVRASQPLEVITHARVQLLLRLS